MGGRVVSMFTNCVAFGASTMSRYAEHGNSVLGYSYRFAKVGAVIVTVGEFMAYFGKILRCVGRLMGGTVSADADADD